MKGQNAQIKSRNRFLEGHNKRDDQQIENFKASISKKQTEIWNLKKENEKLRTSAINREKHFRMLIQKFAGEKLGMLAAFEKYVKEDEEEDQEREAVITDLENKLKVEIMTNAAALANLKTATSRVADLEAENDLLVTKQAQLDGSLKETREKLQKAEKDLGDSEGKRATLEEQLYELTTKEKSAQVEIQSLLGKLSEAKIDVEAAKEQVLAANEHAKSHWHTLQTIRADGGWLSKEERDTCDVISLVTKFDCEFQAGPGYKEPEPLVLKPTSKFGVDPKVENAADIENPFN